MGEGEWHPFGTTEKGRLKEREREGELERDVEETQSSYAGDLGNGTQKAGANNCRNCEGMHNLHCSSEPRTRGSCINT